MTEEQAAKKADIPDGHRMRKTEEGTKGFLGNADFCRFEELDSAGKVIARWEELVHTNVKTGKETTTFRKL